MKASTMMRRWAAVVSAPVFLLSVFILHEYSALAGHNDLTPLLEISLLAASAITGSYLILWPVMELRDHAELRALHVDASATTPAPRLTGATSPTGWLFAWRVSLLQLLAIGTYPLVQRSMRSPGAAEALALVGGALHWVGWAMLVLALWRHYLPNADRRAKYNFWLAGDFLGVWGSLLFAEDIGSRLWLYVINPLALLISCFVWHRVVRPAEPMVPGASDGRRTLALYRFGMLPGALLNWRWLLLRTVSFLFLLVSPALAGISDLVMLSLFIIRYFTKERLSLTPLLYLRSFNHPDVALVASKIVAPVVEYAVVDAVVHPRQRGSELHGKLRFSTPQLSTFALSDAHWQDWIAARMRCCMGVVVDATAASGGLSWELEQALEIVPRAHIVFLVPLNSAAPDPGVKTITYDPRQPKHAAKELTDWVKSIQQPNGTPDPT
jgi:hypothetical protein